MKSPPTADRRAAALPVSLLLLAAVGCGIGVPAEMHADGDAAAIGQIVNAAWRAHIDAGKRKDLAAVLDIYAEDVVYVVPGHVDVSGIDTLREIEATTLATATVLEAEHTTRSLQVFDDVAYEVGTVVGPVRVGDAAARVVRYHFMAMWQRGSDGAWRVRHIVGQTPADEGPGP